MLIQNFIKFLEQSPTNYHACKILSDQLIKHKFTELKESKPWKLKQGGRYFICRNGTSICAFIVPNKKLHAFLITASHTDSPALKLKPNPEFYQDNMVLWKTDVYGGPLCNAWLNRELSLSGSVYLQQNKSVIQKLVFIKEYPVIIPQLAIHLDSEIKQNVSEIKKKEANSKYFILFILIPFSISKKFFPHLYITFYK